jgi:hypothetical protein
MESKNLFGETVVDVTALTLQQKNSLLNSIEKLVDTNEEKGLTDEMLQIVDSNRQFLADTLQITEIQAILFAAFLNRASDNYIWLSEIGEDLKCSNFRIWKYLDDIETLVKKRFIRCRNSDDKHKYCVPNEVLDALRQNQVYQPKSTKNLSVEDFFDCIHQLFGELEDTLTYENFTAEVSDLLNDNSQLSFTQHFTKLNLETENQVLLLRFCNLFVENNDDDIRFHDFEDYFSKHISRKIKYSLSEKQNELFEKGIIECNNDDGFEERESFKLTDKAKRDLLGELNIPQKQAKAKKELIPFDRNAVKSLFYNKREPKQISQLAALLKEENFANVQQRLKDKGMRAGFACLFHGAPGTGKTETVYQIARQTERNIFMVDISETKSMWFGQSEKQIKCIFEKYRALLKTEKIAPILLFNEADAVISKRKDVASGSCAQTENAIQNIILQEMENLNGIMIATTNLTQNLDKAFERRFLYKIEFSKPSAEAKSKIWQSIIQTLQPDEAEQLAQSFDFSGGQIENIARKCAVDSVISGNEPNFGALLLHCENELLTDSRKRIGF